MSPWMPCIIGLIKTPVILAVDLIGMTIAWYVPNTMLASAFWIAWDNQGGINCEALLAKLSRRPFSVVGDSLLDLSSSSSHGSSKFSLFGLGFSWDHFSGQGNSNSFFSGDWSKIFEFFVSTQKTAKKEKVKKSDKCWFLWRGIEASIAAEIQHFPTYFGLVKKLLYKLLTTFFLIVKLVADYSIYTKTLSNECKLFSFNVLLFEF